MLVFRRVLDTSLKRLVPRFSSLSTDVVKTEDDIFAKYNEDVSHVGPSHSPSFNIAAYVNRSDILKKLVELGVDLYRIETTKNALEIVLGLREEDVVKYMRFLEDNGLDQKGIARFFSRNPFIFKQDLEDLTVRINYLKSKNFTPDGITRILTVNPRWLQYRTQEIDRRLGFFQYEFALQGNEVRTLAVKRPQIVTLNLRDIQVNHFSLKEEMGFTPEEAKTILLTRPKVLCLKGLMLVFDYLHNKMNIPHSLMVQLPGVLLSRYDRLRERNEFLVKLGKAQYDPLKPCYVSPLTLVTGSDAEFCSKVAKCPTVVFNTFLKTL